MAEWIRSLNEASIPFILWLQSFRSTPLDAFMLLMTWLGTQHFYIAMIPILYWSISKRWGVLSALALSSSAYLGEFIKWSLKLPRPPSPPVQNLRPEASPGFVSTHAAPAVAVWGTLAFCVRRWWFTLLALFMIASISLSRLYVGVHFPADVVGGWVVGLLAIGFVLKVVPWLEPRLQKWTVARQVVATLLLAAVLLAIFPGDWDGHRPAETGILNVGLLTGFLMGLIWDRARLHFAVDGPWKQRVLRCVVGLILLLALYLALRELFKPFSEGSLLVGQALRLARYVVVGFAITGLAPWLFGRLPLA